MSARVTTLPCLLLAAVLALAATPAHAFWTTPDPVVAGQPTRVVFMTSSHGGRPDVEVRVEGDQIVLMQSNLCFGNVCFATWVPATTEATLPPLEPGTYTVTLAWEGDGLPPRQVATLEVQSEASTRVLPAEGFWAPTGQPGSGLFLERRGNLLAVSTYSYERNTGTAGWLLGTGTYAGDSVPLLMNAFFDGDCLGCEEHRAPMGPGGMTVMQLRFESARRAWLDIGDFHDNPADIPLTSLPYGAAYIPHTLSDTVDPDFGPLPLPDLRGSWLVAIEGEDAPAVSLDIELDAWTLDGEVVRFSGDVEVECRSATDTRRAGCTFRPELVPDPPPPEPIETFLGSGWFVPLGDIEEDRIRGVFEAGGQTWRVQGFRTGDAGG